MRKLWLTTFGGLTFQDSRGAEYKIPTRKTAAMVAYLAVQAGKKFRRDHLANMFWGDKADRWARHSLSQAFSDVKRILGEDTLLFDGQFVQINSQAIETDAFDMARLAGQRQLEPLTRAEKLYQGDFLAGMELDQEEFDTWLLSERERLRQVVQRAIGTLLTLHADGTDTQSALRVARSLLDIDPFDDAAHCSVMQAYARSGRRRLALAHFHQYCADLRHELDESPSDEVVRTYQTILADKSVARRSILSIQDYALVIEQIPHPAVVTDLRNRMVGWNGLAESLLGFSKAEMLGRSPGVIFAPGGDASLSHSILEQAVSNGRWSGTAILRAKDGQRLQQKRIVAPLYAADGELIGAFGYGLHNDDGVGAPA
jgi:PAS domain S-box-containing protein